jgi:hypothetical protein
MAVPKHVLYLIEKQRAKGPKATFYKVWVTKQNTLSSTDQLRKVRARSMSESMPNIPLATPALRKFDATADPYFDEAQLCIGSATP